jgi:glutathione S-transferase
LAQANRPEESKKEDAMKLYGFGPTRSLRVLCGLRELGVDFEFEVVNLIARENQRPEFLRLNPTGKLPVLVDGDLVLTESAAIVLYLAEKYPHGKLLPPDLKTRAEVYRWVMFAMTELEQPLWRITRNAALLPPDKRLPQDIALAREDFARMASVFERHMEGRTFIVGDAITAADCVTGYLMDWANENGLLDGMPNLQAYLERMYTRPAAPQRIAAATASIRQAAAAAA